MVVDAIIIVWVITLIIGMVTTGLTLNDALADRRWLRESGHNGASKFIADASVRSEMLRLLTMFLFLPSAIVILIFDPPRGDFLRTIIYGGFLVGIVVLVSSVLIERRSRKLFINCYTDGHLKQ